MSSYQSKCPAQTDNEHSVITAVNDEGGEVNVARDAEGQDTIPNIAKRYKSKDQPWMLVVDDVSREVL